VAFLLDDILLAPVKFVQWIGKTLYEQAQTELTDESVIHQRLLELQARFELEQITEQEFIEQENALMRRLDQIRRYKESKQEQT